MENIKVVFDVFKQGFVSDVNTILVSPESLSPAFLKDPYFERIARFLDKEEKMAELSLSEQARVVQARQSYSEFTPAEQSAVDIVSALDRFGRALRNPDYDANEISASFLDMKVVLEDYLKTILFSSATRTPAFNSDNQIARIAEYFDRKDVAPAAAPAESVPSPDAGELSQEKFVPLRHTFGLRGAVGSEWDLVLEKYHHQPEEYRIGFAVNGQMPNQGIGMQCSQAQAVEIFRAASELGDDADWSDAKELVVSLVTRQIDTPTSNSVETSPQSTSPQLIKRVNQARQSYSGFSEREQLAVEAMMDVNSFQRLLNDPNSSMEDIEANFDALRQVFISDVNTILVSLKSSSPAFLQNSDIEKIAKSLNMGEAAISKLPASEKARVVQARQAYSEFNDSEQRAVTIARLFDSFSHEHSEIDVNMLCAEFLSMQILVEENLRKILLSTEERTPAFMADLDLHSLATYLERTDVAVSAAPAESVPSPEAGELSQEKFVPLRHTFGLRGAVGSEWDLVLEQGHHQPGEYRIGFAFSGQMPNQGIGMQCSQAKAVEIFRAASELGDDADWSDAKELIVSLVTKQINTPIV